MKQALKTSRLLIADKSMLFCRGLRTLWAGEKDLQVVELASTTAEVLLKARLIVPDVLIIGVELLLSSDSSFTLAMRQIMSEGAVLVLTESDSEECLAQAIAVGAHGYMLKSSVPADLTEGIRQIVWSRSYGPQQISRIIPDLKALAAQNEKKASPSALTMRENEVLRLLAEGKTVREAADELSLSIKTIEAHKLNLMRKLDIHHRAALVAYAVQHGMVTV